MSVSEEFKNTITRDAFWMLAGEELGYGVGREVFVCRVDPSLVVKFENRAHSFQNIAEWEIWSDQQHVPAIARWLAPCRMISPCGTVLLQERTSPVEQRHLPKRVPTFLTDLKVQNYGRLGRRVVCHDYARSILTLSVRPKRAEWWDENTVSR